MTIVPGEESPTPPGDESEAIDCQPLVCASPVVDSQLAEGTAGMLCPVVDDPEDCVFTWLCSGEV